MNNKGDTQINPKQQSVDSSSLTLEALKKQMITKKEMAKLVVQLVRMTTSREVLARYAISEDAEEREMAQVVVEALRQYENY